jgi:hypothetical protein
MRYIIHKDDAIRRENARAAISELSNDKPWVVEIKPYVKKRSLEQNAFLHAVPLRMIADETGHDVEDMKTYLMGEAFGWLDYEVMGSPRRKPLLGTSELNAKQFMWFLEWVEAWAVRELGMMIPKPNEVL